MSTPDPQDPLSPLYVIVDTQPESTFPNTLDTTPSHFTDRQYTPTAITAAFPPVVTLASHGLENGMAIRATKFITMPRGSETGMEQLNNRTFYVQQATTNTFELYDANSKPIDGSNYTAYVSGGQFTVSGPDILCVNPSTFPPE